MSTDNTGTPPKVDFAEMGQSFVLKLDARTQRMVAPLADALTFLLEERAGGAEPGATKARELLARIRGEGGGVSGTGRID